MDQKTIRHIARLAELSLSEDEEAILADEIRTILAFVAELQAVDTEGVEPTGAVAERTLAGLREDVPEPSLDRAEVLAQAPRAEEAGFAVPTFVEGA